MPSVMFFMETHSIYFGKKNQILRLIFHEKEIKKSVNQLIKKSVKVKIK